MNDTTKAQADGDAEPRPGEAGAETRGLSPPAGEGRDAGDVIEALNAENAALKDRVLRGLAEMENLRRRSEREAADARAYGATAFARDMLAVIDNLSRALDSLPEGSRASADGAFKSLIDGVELTARDMQAALARHGVKKLEPLGEKFDPNFHQAMFEEPNESVPNGTVTKVLQNGWTIGERVLRPAMVGVSRGGPRTPKPE